MGGVDEGANWEVGHTQYVTYQLLHDSFQTEKVRLVGLSFNKIKQVSGGLMDNTKWMKRYVRKNIIFCTDALESCVPAHENTK